MTHEKFRELLGCREKFAVRGDAWPPPNLGRALIELLLLLRYLLIFLLSLFDSSHFKRILRYSKKCAAAIYFSMFSITGDRFEWRKKWIESQPAECSLKSRSPRMLEDNWQRNSHGAVYYYATPVGRKFAAEWNAITRFNHSIVCIVLCLVSVRAMRNSLCS